MFVDRLKIFKFRTSNYVSINAQYFSVQKKNQFELNPNNRLQKELEKSVQNWERNRVRAIKKGRIQKLLLGADKI